MRASPLRLALFQFFLPISVWCTALAQDYPVRPIRVITGGGTDVIGRVVGQELSEMWRQQVVNEDRPGAGGSIAAEFVAKSPWSIHRGRFEEAARWAHNSPRRRSTLTPVPRIRCTRRTLRRASPALHARRCCAHRARAAACRAPASSGRRRPCWWCGTAPGTAPARGAPAHRRPAPLRKAERRRDPSDQSRTPPCST